MKTLMRWGAVIVASAVVVAAASGLVAAAQAFEPVRLAPGDLAWDGSADTVSRAQIAGDNETSGMYAYRARFPEGFRNEPHFHPDDRIVTVISGTLHMGYGDAFDEARMRALPEGSVWTEPGGQPHFVWAQEGEVTIQVIGVGPSGTTQVEQ